MKHDEVQPLIEEVIARKSTLQRLERYISDTPDIKNINAPFTISDEDKANGHPKPGDWIGINASNPRDRWLITKEFFDNNYEIISSRRNDPTEELIKEKGLTSPRLTKDDLDALMRHLMENGMHDIDGVRHSAKIAWRALAHLQKEIEGDKFHKGYDEQFAHGASMPSTHHIRRYFLNSSSVRELRLVPLTAFDSSFLTRSDSDPHLAIHYDKSNFNRKTNP